MTVGNLVGFKSYPNPPWIVNQMACAVCVIIGEEESWNKFKETCSDKTLLNRIKNVDRNNFSIEDFERLKVYFSIKDFNEESCKKHSKACGIFFNW